MTTHRAIVDSLSRAASAGESTVLATVVRVTGSSYGGVGARMLVRVDGSTVGLVSGGCLESDLAEHARRVSGTQRAEVVRYDTRNDEDAPWGLGLGCNGLIDVLVEPLSPEQAGDIANILEKALTSDEPAVIATVIKSDAEKNSPALGAHALLFGGGVKKLGDWGSNRFLAEAGARRDDALAAGRRGFVQEVAGAEIAFEVVNPSLQFVVCGSGPDALPIAAIAVQLGWTVTVVDHRPLTDSHVGRFPGARVVECSDATKLAAVVNLTPRTAAVVASHHFERDRNYMQALLASDADYIGMLGPRARTEKMLADLAERGIRPDTSRLFAPVGMDIGGDGPDAIALSIVTEAATVMNHRTCGHLRDKRGPLHLPTPRAVSSS